MPGALEHLRVVDLTDLRGALAGRILADLGADVVKIEPPGGDPDRLRPPFAGNEPGADRSLPFLYRNANKRSAVFDLGDAAERERFAALLDRTDVLVENLGLEDRKRLGLSPRAVAERHPHLVHAVIADFGLAGPRASWRAEALPAFAASGALYVSGFPEFPPCWSPGYLAHDCASTFALAGILAAIRTRAATGHGDLVEVSVQEAALNGLNPWSIPLEDYARHFPALPTSPRRNADGPYHVHAVRDGFIRILPGSTRQWRSFVEMIGRDELAGPEWLSPLFRIGAQDVIRMIAAEWFASRTTAEALAAARARGIPVTAVNAPEDFVAEEQTKARGYFRRTGFPHLEDAPFASAPFLFSRTPVSLRRAAPAPGRDDREPFPPRSREAAKSSPRGTAPLDGIRVIGLTCGAVGPETCWLLAELGADVVKIESRANLDFLRGVTFDGDPNHSWTFSVESRNQKSVCLDLSTARGRELALGLCATADVVVENNRGGVARGWGLDYEAVRRVRPDVIYLSSQGFGDGGPLGDCPSFGPLNSTFAGVNWLWNHPQAPYPAGCALNHPDHIAGKLGTVAVLAALEHRRRTGEGQRIEMAQSEAAAFLAGEFYLEESATGARAAQRGNAAPYAVPHGVYPSRAENGNDDRWIAIAAVGDEAWLALERTVGWRHDERLARLEARVPERAEIDARLSDWSRTKTAAEAAAELQAAGVSAMPVQDANDHRSDPHLRERVAIVTVEHPDLGAERHIGNPIRLGRSGLATPSAAPLLGQHTEEVLSAVLGLSREEIARLTEEGVCR